MPKTKIVLTKLRKRGYTLILVARAVPGRKKMIKLLGITSFFKKIITTSNKSRTLFKRLALNRPESCIVVGDRIKKEIAIGNSLNMTTIWLRQGRFRNELPNNIKQKPTHTIYNLLEILKLLP